MMLHAASISPVAHLATRNTIWTAIRQTQCPFAFLDTACDCGPVCLSARNRLDTLRSDGGLCGKSEKDVDLFSRLAILCLGPSVRCAFDLPWVVCRMAQSARRACHRKTQQWAGAVLLILVCSRTLATAPGLRFLPSFLPWPRFLVVGGVLDESVYTLHRIAQRSARHIVEQRLCVYCSARSDGRTACRCAGPSIVAKWGKTMTCSGSNRVGRTLSS